MKSNLGGYVFFKFLRLNSNILTHIFECNEFLYLDNYWR